MGQVFLNAVRDIHLWVWRDLSLHRMVCHDFSHGRAMASSLLCLEANARATQKDSSGNITSGYEILHKNSLRGLRNGGSPAQWSYFSAQAFHILKSLQSRMGYLVLFLNSS